MASNYGAEWINRASRRQNLELSIHQRPRRASEFNPHPPPKDPRPRRASEFQHSESLYTPPQSIYAPRSLYTPSRISLASANVPSSPSESVESGNTEWGDQLQALQQKLRSNNALIESNEEQMRMLDDVDERVSTGIQQRLASVQVLNERLNYLGKMLARIDAVSSGEF